MTRKPKPVYVLFFLPGIIADIWLDIDAQKALLHVLYRHFRNVLSAAPCGFCMHVWPGLAIASKQYGKLQTGSH